MRFASARFPPTFWIICWTTPPSCKRSASSRCSTSICPLLCCFAISAASLIASRALSVNRSIFIYHSLSTEFFFCRGNTPVQVGRLRRPQVGGQVGVCLACAGAHAKHTPTCPKGLFAAQPQHVRMYCPHCFFFRGCKRCVQLNMFALYN